MPTVLRIAGFRISIFLPPREHGPPHVHVRNARGYAVIDLAALGKPQRVRRYSGLREREAAIAFAIVEQYQDYLLRCWRKHHD